MKDKLLSLEWWTKLFSGFAAIGIVLALVGRIAKAEAMVHVGMCLAAPLLVLGGVLLVVAVPYILLRGRRKE